MNKTSIMALILWVLLLLIPASSGLAFAQGGIPLRFTSFKKASPEKDSHQFLTLKVGYQDATNSGDQYFKDMEAEHGALNEERKTSQQGVEYDLVVFPRPSIGVGFGLEYSRYHSRFTFGGANPAVVDINGKSILYTLKFYYQFGMAWAFFGLGSGHYFLNYSEPAAAISYPDSAPEVFHYRLGFRLNFDGWGLLLERGETHAPVVISIRPNQPELELGGSYYALGISILY